MRVFLVEELEEGVQGEAEETADESSVEADELEVAPDFLLEFLGEFGGVPFGDGVLDVGLEVGRGVVEDGLEKRGEALIPELLEIGLFENFS